MGFDTGERKEGCRSYSDCCMFQQLACSTCNDSYGLSLTTDSLLGDDRNLALYYPSGWCCHICGRNENEERDELGLTHCEFIDCWRGWLFWRKTMFPKEMSYSVSGEECVVAYQQMFLNRATMISVCWLMFSPGERYGCDSHCKINRYMGDISFRWWNLGMLSWHVYVTMIFLLSLCWY